MIDQTTACPQTKRMNYSHRPQIINHSKMHTVFPTETWRDQEPGVDARSEITADSLWQNVIIYTTRAHLPICNTSKPAEHNELNSIHPFQPKVQQQPQLKLTS